MSDQTRAVWLTREQRDALDDYLEFNQRIVAAWDAAPADPAEAIEQGMFDSGASWEPQTVAAVLAALGAPRSAIPDEGASLPDPEDTP